jgi:hypothetical protein
MSSPATAREAIPEAVSEKRELEINKGRAWLAEHGARNSIAVGAGALLPSPCVMRWRVEKA